MGWGRSGGAEGESSIVTGFRGSNFAPERLLSEPNRMQKDSERPRRRPRVSLLNLLLLLTTAALAVGLYQARQENIRILARVGPLEAENKRLRAEQGALTVEDPQKVYAIRLPEIMESVWRYRVYLPPGRDYYVAAQANDLPQGEAMLRVRFGGDQPPGTSTIASGRAKNGGRQAGMGRAPGEILVTVRLYTNDEGEKAFTLRAGPPGRQGSTGFAIPSEPDKWPAIEKVERQPGEEPRSFSYGGITEARQNAYPVTRMPIILLNYRVMHSGVRSSADSDEGLLVWVGRADEHLQETE
ncbi:hypothetical protein MalM25_07670 [Planctomycetes bacterium MalM25]|nr:hypothetical protein MalM25_07670 [Planctomycetes bacterium MalM25]